MSKAKRIWEQLTDEERKKVKDDLILFFENERDERIGVIAAEDIIAFFLQSVGNKLYNQGVNDAKKALNERMQELNYDLDDLVDI